MQNSGMPIIACVLKLGGDFRPEHVKYLALQLDMYITIPYQFVCLTDMEVELPENIKGIILPLINNWPGWWSKIELFRVPGNVISFDLDTMFFGNIDKLIKAVAQSKNKFWMLKSFLPPERGLSGIMAWNGDWKQIYQSFNYEKQGKQYKGDQTYIREYLKSIDFPVSYIQDELEGVYSWKRNCGSGIPEKTNILVFHGKPRPWKLDSLWLPMIEEFTR